MFDPINSDHAIQSVAFGIVFDGPAGESAARSIRSNRDLLAELPAVQEPDVIEFGLQTGHSPSIGVPRRLKGIQLAHLRPDGTPAWALRTVGNELAVECTRYTRWERVWSAAAKYLSAGLSAVAGANKDRKVAVVSLEIVDAFIANREDYNLSSLLKEGPLVASKVFSASPTWHSHIGWFDSVDAFGAASQLCLNHVNIDARRVAPDEGAVDKSLRVIITHRQELRPNPGIPLPSPGDLAVLMNILHLNNKRILSSLIVSAMAQRIGLESDNVTAS